MPANAIVTNVVRNDTVFIAKCPNCTFLCIQDTLKNRCLICLKMAMIFVFIDVSEMLSG